VKSGAWRGWVVPVLLLTAAEWAMRTQQVPNEALAAPSASLKSLFAQAADGTLWAATGQTMGSAIGGLLIGGGLGLLLGLWFGLVPRIANAGALSVELLRPLPSVALIPVSMLAFGFGFRMEMAVVAFTCMWPMLLLTQAAVRQVEPRLLEVGRVLRLSPVSQTLKLVLPAAAPRIFVAFRLSVGVALVVAVTVEIAANPQGLGYGMISAQQALMPEQMFALLVWTGLIGWAASAGLVALERRLFAHQAAPR
jgi:ABC-type nitrate/sulfonate/bicarbonate transport system permease component